MRDAGNVSPVHCGLGSCRGHNGIGRGRRLICSKNLKAAIRRLENCGENKRLPGIETDDSSPDRGAVVGEEIKQSRVRVDWAAGTTRSTIRILKIDEILRARGGGVAIVSVVKDAVGPTKFSHAAGGLVDGVEGRRSCGSGRW